MALISRRAKQRQATIEEIKAIARQRVEREGLAGLSLGAIARAMGLTTPALYRYFSSRDALIEELVAEAFDSLAERLAASEVLLPSTSYASRFRALLDAYRQWAVASPDQYALVYTTPQEITQESNQRTRQAAFRSLRIFTALLVEADQAIGLRVPSQYEQPPLSLAEELERLQPAFGQAPIPHAILTVAIALWLKMHGLIWHELYGRVAAGLLNDGQLYAMEVAALSEQLNLRDAG